MSNAEPGENDKIFVSYRRSDQPFAALLLYHELVRVFGSEHVVLDVSVAQDRPYPEELQAGLDRAAVVLAVVGPGWYGKGEHDTRLIDDPDDWVRREIEFALQNDRTIVQVLVGGAGPLPRAGLPKSIAKLHEWPSQGLEIRAGWEDVLERLCKLIAARLPDRVTAHVDRINALPTTDPLRQYLRAVGRQHARLRGARFETMPLERVFVPLRVAPEHGELPRLADGSVAPEALLERVCEMDSPLPRAWVVLGDPGAGKSTLLRNRCRELSSEGDGEGGMVPVFLSLAAWQREGGSLWQHAAFAVVEGGSDEQRGDLGGRLERLADDGRVCALLDGLDEVPPERQATVVGWITSLHQEHRRLRLVVTSRPVGYRHLEGFLVARIQPLREPEQRMLLAKWLDEADAGALLSRLAASPFMRDMGSNVLLLTLMAWLARERGVADVPDRTNELYGLLIEELLQRGYEDGNRGLEEWVSALDVLRALALALLRAEQGGEVWSTAELVAALDGLPAKCRGSLVELWHGPQQFLEAVAVTGLLSQRRGVGGGWSFLHRTFREALAAQALRGKSRRSVMALAKKLRGSEARWAETFALLAGFQELPDPWLLWLAKANPDLALRALMSVERASEQTLFKILRLDGEDRQKRFNALAGVKELVGGDVEVAARLLGRLAGATDDCEELWHIDLHLERLRAEAPDREAIGVAMSRLFEHESFGEPIDARTLQWVSIPNGEFVMGSPEGERQRWDDEDQHEERFEDPYAVNAVAVTNAEYRRFRPAHKFDAGRENHPVVEVTWFEAAMYCRWLGDGVRLPSEAEWEYACRAGTETPFAFGKDITPEQVNYNGNHPYGSAERGLYRESTVPVGSLPANDWGLHEMHGNVLEWCMDSWAFSFCVVRGGSWFHAAGRCRSASRGGIDPVARLDYVGFRIASSSPLHLTTSPLNEHGTTDTEQP